MTPRRDDTSHERTAEERERARLEREARRRGGSVPPPPIPDLMPEPPAASLEPEPPAAPLEPEPVEQPSPPEPLEPREPLRPRHRPGIARPHMPHLRRPHAAARAPRETTPARKWGIRVIALLALLLAAFAIWFAVSMFQPFKGAASSTRVTIAIPRGASADRIGDLLEREGVISSAFFFGLRVRLAGKREELKPGVYRLRRDLAYGDALTILDRGPPPARTVAITIPEGRSRREEARRLATTSLRGDYLPATKRSRVLSPRRYGAPASTPSLEGFLFPATYQVRQGAAIKALVNQQLLAFKRATRRVSMRYARRRNLTTYDVLIIASMVEREAMLRRERPIVASVIYNRLKANIPLGIDATIRYATGNWTRPLTASQLRIASPFNTRTRQGLPPSPIDSPGLASIRAAAHPKRTRYLYYVVKPGGCGEHVFTTTFAAFQRASARYNAAREAKGGRSPTKCPG
jgi:uncharacterized YceG family protein